MDTWIGNEQGERYEFDRYDQTRISEHKYAFRTNSIRVIRLSFAVHIQFT
jgi:hypothetical protein